MLEGHADRPVAVHDITLGGGEGNEWLLLRFFLFLLLFRRALLSSTDRKADISSALSELWYVPLSPISLELRRAVASGKLRAITATMNVKDVIVLSWTILTL